MKRQKMITLCPTTYEIAQGMTNFSGWVRNQLLSMNIREENKETHQFVCTDCDTILYTHKDIDMVPHATRYLGQFMHENCRGHFVKVTE